LDSRALGATLIGAVAGGVAGYLFFTEHGKSLRKALDPTIEDLAKEIEGFRSTVQRAISVANDGWQLVDDAMNTRSRRMPGAVHQSSPF